MKKIIISIIALSLIISFNIQLMADEYNPGKSWLCMSEGSRLDWVWGFSQGQELILEELEIKSHSNLKYIISLQDADVISDIMTQYYNDSSNTYIPWKYMTYIAKMKLEGKPAVKIAEQLELLRRYAAYERKKKK